MRAAAAGRLPIGLGGWAGRGHAWQARLPAPLCARHTHACMRHYGGWLAQKPCPLHAPQQRPEWLLRCACWALQDGDYTFGRGGGPLHAQLVLFLLERALYCYPDLQVRTAYRSVLVLVVLRHARAAWQAWPPAVGPATSAVLAAAARCRAAAPQRSCCMGHRAFLHDQRESSLAVQPFVWVTRLLRLAFCLGTH
jgi:hypothetical protein